MPDPLPSSDRGDSGKRHSSGKNRRNNSDAPFTTPSLMWFATIAVGLAIVSLVVMLSSNDGSPGKLRDGSLPSGMGPGQMQLINTPLPVGIGSGQMQLVNTPISPGIGSGQMQLIKQNAPYLGLSLSTIPPDVATRLRLEINQGVYVNAVVPASPGEKGGLTAGDVLIKLEGTDITKPDDVTLFLSNKVAGDVVKAVVVRGGSKKSMHITLDSRSRPPQSF